MRINRRNLLTASAAIAGSSVISMPAVLGQARARAAEVGGAPRVQRRLAERFPALEGVRNILYRHGDC